MAGIIACRLLPAGCGTILATQVITASTARRLSLRLKADLHLHTRERELWIRYQARELIDRAAAQGFRVLSITNHDLMTWSDDLAAHAAARGVLLVPGAEVTVEGKHVLVLNPDVSPERLRTFAALRRHKRSDWLVMAPHPFYPARFCLGNRLAREIDLFDAVEFSHFYRPPFDWNRRAARFARDTGLPLVGSSDSHIPAQLGTTYSLIDADELTIPAVLAAVRRGRVSVVSRPLAAAQFARIGVEMAFADVRHRLARMLAGRRGDSPRRRPVVRLCPRAIPSRDPE
jgi:predicted metal-dependent phosphoesterase TrpH